MRCFANTHCIPWVPVLLPSHGLSFPTLKSSLPRVTGPLEKQGPYGGLARACPPAFPKTPSLLAQKKFSNEMQTTSTCLSRRALPAGENIMAGDTADKLSLLKKLLQQTKALSFSQQPIAPMLDSKSSVADPRTPTQLTLDRRTKALFGRVPSGNVELA